MSNSSIWPIDRTLSGATTPGQNAPKSDCNEGYSAFLKAPALLKPHHQIFCVISRTLVGSRVLPLCRDTVGVFYTPSRLGLNNFLKILTLVQKTVFSKWFNDVLVCRNFVKELVILFHRISAAPWGHMVSTIKKKSYCCGAEKYVDPANELCEWEQPKQYEGTKARLTSITSDNLFCHIYKRECKCPWWFYVGRQLGWVMLLAGKLRSVES